MSASTLAAGRTVWSTVARIVAWVVLVAALIALVFLVYVWPWLLAVLAAGAAFGALPWLFRRFGMLRASLIIVFGLVAVLAIVGSLFSGLQHAVEPTPRPGAQPARYFAEYTYVSTGDWSGMEYFDLKRDQALNFTGRGPRPLADRLAKALPPDWTVKPLGTSGFRVEHQVESQRFEIPKRKPMTVSAHLRVPELDARAPRLPVFAEAGSTVLLHAPAMRIHATKPATSPQSEGTKTSVREVKLTGAQERPIVTVEIKSNLASQLPDAWLAPTFIGVVTAVFSTLGLTLIAAFTLVARAGHWMIGRASTPAPRTERVLGGQEEKAAALRAYLTERGVVGALAEKEMVRITHEAKKLAIEVLEIADADGARIRYQAELKKLTANGTTELDAVYAALRAAGLPDTELRWLDQRLDETIINGQEPAAP